MSCIPQKVHCKGVKRHIATLFDALKLPLFWGFLGGFLANACTCPILGPLVPLCWISSDIPSGFQSRSGFCLIRFCRGKCSVHSQRSTSDATPADLLTAIVSRVKLFGFLHFSVKTSLIETNSTAQSTLALKSVTM